MAGKRDKPTQPKAPPKPKPTPPTLSETIDVVIGRARCSSSDPLLNGKTAQQLYDVLGPTGPYPEWWLIPLTINNLDKAKRTIVAWLQRTAATLPDGKPDEIKKRIEALTHDADAGTLAEAVSWVWGRRKAGNGSALERAYMFAAQYLQGRHAESLFASSIGSAIITHQVRGGASREEAYADAYTFLRAEVDFAAFNPGGLK